MRTRLPLLSVLLLFLNATTATAAKSPPKLADLPTDAATRGTLFIDAWKTFHQEMNGLCAAKVRESESEAWLDAAPLFLQREIVRLAADPEVRYQAAVRLAAHPSAENLQLLRTLRTQYEGTLLGTLSAGMLISAGDREIRARLVADLKSTVMERRVTASTALAAAADREGIAYLRAVVEEHGEEGRFAAWALGRFGQVADEKRLTSIAESRPNALVFSAALGELRFRRLFPELYAGYLSRFRFHTDGFDSEGMYTVWFSAVRRALSEGARKPEQLRESILRQKRALLSGGDGDLTDRRLAAFVDFLEEMRRMQNGPAEPAWPRTRAAAETALRKRKSADITPERITAERIAASIALLADLAPLVRYSQLAEPTPLLTALSPSGERALDGNPATSKHITPKSPLILSHPTGKLRTLWVLSVCTGGANRFESPAIRITGADLRGRAWEVTAPADTTGSLFREIPVNRLSDGRIRVFPGSPPAGPSPCISEIRARFESNATEK